MYYTNLPWDVTLALAIVVVVSIGSFSGHFVRRGWHREVHSPEVAIISSVLSIATLLWVRIDGWASMLGYDTPSMFNVIDFVGLIFGVVFGFVATGAFISWLAQTIRGADRVHKSPPAWVLAIAALAMFALSLSYLAIFGHSV